MRLKTVILSISLSSAAVAAMLVATSAAPAIAQQGVTDSEILIGAFGPLTGPASWVGSGARDGLMVATGEINKNGGINGRRLRLIFEDAVKPAESIAAAKKLVEQEKVYVLILGSGSTGAEAAADYLRSSRVPAFNIVGVTPKIRRPFARNIFHGTTPEADAFTESYIANITARNPRPNRVAILAGSYAYAQAELSAVQPRLKKAGLEVATIEHFELGDKSFIAQLVSIARTKPDLVIFLGHYTEGALAIKQASETGLHNIPWLVGTASVTRAFPKLAGTAAEGVTSAWLLPYFYTEDEKPILDFNRKWQAMHGAPPQGRPNYVDVLAYGDLYVAALAIKKAGKDLSWDNLIRSWESLTNAKPSDLGTFASDVIFPETFATNDHQGNKKLIPIIIDKGSWKAQR